MPSRFHVLVNKPFENVQAGQRVALSPLGFASFKKAKFTEHTTLLAEELENGTIQLVGANEPLELEHSRTLLMRDGTLHHNYKDLAKPEVFAKNKKAREAAKEPGSDRQAAGPAAAR